MTTRVVTPIDKKMDEWTDKLATRLSEIQLWDMQQIKDAIGVHLQMAMADCLKIQVSDSERRVKQVKIQIANAAGSSTQHLLVELHELKEKVIAEKSLLKATNALTGIKAQKKKGTEFLTLVCDVLRERFDEQYVKQLIAEAKQKQHGR